MDVRARWIAATMVLLLSACGGGSGIAPPEDGGTPGGPDVDTVDDSDTAGGQADGSDQEVVGGKDVGGADDAVSDTVIGPGGEDATDATGGDADEDDAAAGMCMLPSPVGCPCSDNVDCASGFCVPTANGNECTKTCDTTCPEGWSCSPVTGGAEGTTVYICLPLYTNLCRPCETGADCGQLGDNGGFCLEYEGGVGSFCGGDCDEDAPCPSGYLCEQVSVGSPGNEQVVGQCVPESGECTCNDAASKDGAWTACSVTSPAGICEGTRVCDNDGLSACDAPVPAPEICNLEDDDCDGDVDEELVVDCEKSNDIGTCYGVESCIAGELVGCNALEPAEEACDGIDNNCDGLTDEGFDNSDGDALADCVDPDIDQDGVANDDDNCPEDLNPQQENNDYDLEIAEGLDVLGDACDDDDDNDGALDEEDCAPFDAATQCTIFYYDEDEDGAGKCQVKLCLCTSTGFYTVTECNADPEAGEVTQDCDDEVAVVHPGGEEICDTYDNDCNGVADDDWPDAGKACDGEDLDQCKAGNWTCSEDGASVFCDEVAGNTAQEVCDGFDNDCDDEIDEGEDGGVLTQECYTGLAGTVGIGACAPGLATCLGEDGFGTCVGQITPGEEVCDGLDNDCDGETDEELGSLTCGIGACSKEVPACLDGAPNSCDPLAGQSAEVCDGVDNDCDGYTDAEDLNLLLDACELQDGACWGAQKTPAMCQSGVWLPCTANDYAAHSDEYEDGTEVSCDGADNDCDGAPDDDFGMIFDDGSEVFGSGQPCGTGICSGGVTQCTAEGDGLECSSEAIAEQETCSGFDDDCDGATDAEDESMLAVNCDVQDGVCEGSLRPADLCVGGVWQACTDADYLEWSDDYEPGTELLCDTLDNNCDGQEDEGWEGLGDPCDGDDADDCANGVLVCGGDQLSVVCGTEQATVEEICGNTVDDDCDGELNEGCAAATVDFGMSAGWIVESGPGDGVVGSVEATFGEVGGLGPAVTDPDPAANWQVEFGFGATLAP